MIDWMQSAELNDISIDDLKDYFERFPKSNKKIIAICDECRSEREVSLNNYNNNGTSLCKSCAIRNARSKPESREKSSVATKRRFLDPEEHKKQSETMKEKRREYPELWETDKMKESHKNMSTRLIEWYKVHPEAKDAARKKTIEQFSDPKKREEMSIIKKQYFIDNPEENELNRQRLIQYHIDHPEARNEARKKTIKQFSDPEAREAHRKISIEQFSDPEVRERMSAIKQGIPYDEWDGFYQANWRDWRHTVLLNDPFSKCHRHHITKTLAICIPDELHNHIRHNLRTGNNMGEMNMLALQFMNGGL